MAERAANMKASAIRDTFKLAIASGYHFIGGGFPFRVEAFPRDTWPKSRLSWLWMNASGAALQYGPTEGFVRTPRHSLRKKCDARVFQTPEGGNESVTGGSQQVLDLLGKVFLNQQDPIIVKKPTYIGGLSAMTNYLADPISITSRP